MMIQLLQLTEVGAYMDSIVLTILLVVLVLFCIFMSARGREEGFIFSLSAIIVSLVIFSQNWIIGLILTVITALLLLAKVLGGVRL